MNTIYKLIAVGTLMVAGTTANALVVNISDNLTLTPEGSPGIQQASQGPCVIGDPSCDGALGFTVLPTVGNPTTYLDIFSPVYNVGTFRLAAGDQFSIGIDINRQGNSASDNSHFLNTFVALIDGVQAFAYSGGANLGDPDYNNGNGFSDWRLSGFDISSILDSATLQFGLDLAAVNAGREQFFVITGSKISMQPVVESAPIALLGFGLFGLGLLVQRKQANCLRPLTPRAATIIRRSDQLGYS